MLDRMKCSYSQLINSAKLSLDLPMPFRSFYTKSQVFLLFLTQILVLLELSHT